MKSSLKEKALQNILHQTVFRIRMIAMIHNNQTDDREENVQHNKNRDRQEKNKKDRKFQIKLILARNSSHLLRIFVFLN